MVRFRHVTISGSVGAGGINRYNDVAEIQELLNTRLPAGMRSLRIDGDYGPLTAAAIENVQRRFVGLSRPDGRIDPHGPTLRALNFARPRPHAAHPLAAPSPPPPHTAPAHDRPSPPDGPRSTARPAGADAASIRASGVPADIVAAAQASQAKWRVPASISIAQWILESGSGKHMPPGSNNPFGIKAGRGQPSVTVRTREETREGRSVYIDAPFRRFSSLAEAFDQHGKLLATHPAYALARQHTDDPDAYADALTHHYATDSHYGRLLKSIMRGRNLYRFN